MAIVLCGLGAGCGSLDPSLPVYKSEQTDSSHPGYRRSTVSTAGATYINDFEEQSLLLGDRYPKQVVGRSQFGNGKICAIAGQDPSAYLAVDVGSEMPAYAVYRNANLPPFDWRHAAFQKLRLDVPVGPAANKETTDPGLIEGVLRTLRDGTPATPPVTAPATFLAPPPMVITESPTGVYFVLLFSDQLPGLIFRPSFYLDASRQVYLAENMVVTYTRTEQSVQAAWIPAGPLFARWVQTP
jgi:hypothetical protein